MRLESPGSSSIPARFHRQARKKSRSRFSSSKGGIMKVQSQHASIRCSYDQEVHPFPPPPHSQHEQFLFLRVSVHFILFQRSSAPHGKSLFRPLAPIKPKACCAWVSTPMGRGSRGHFDPTNCLNPRALFAKLCTVPRNLSLSVNPPPFNHSQLSFNPQLSSPFPCMSFFMVRSVDSQFSLSRSAAETM